MTEKKQKSISAETKRDILKHWGKRCAYCGTPADTAWMDHVMPKKHGGGDEIGNIVPSCHHENIRKSGKPLINFAGIKKATAILEKIQSYDQSGENLIKKHTEHAFYQINSLWHNVFRGNYMSELDLICGSRRDGTYQRAAECFDALLKAADRDKQREIKRVYCQSIQQNARKPTNKWDFNIQRLAELSKYQSVFFEDYQDRVNQLIPDITEFVIELFSARHIFLSGVALRKADETFREWCELFDSFLVFFGGTKTNIYTKSVMSYRPSD